MGGYNIMEAKIQAQIPKVNSKVIISVMNTKKKSLLRVIEGAILDIYPHQFLVEYLDSKQNKVKESFKFTDIVSGVIQIEYIK